MALPAKKISTSLFEAISRKSTRQSTPQDETGQIEVSVTQNGQPGFSMFLDWVIENYLDAMIRAETLKVYLTLVKYQNHTTKRSHPGVRLLSRKAKMRPASIPAALAWLEDRGLIELVAKSQGRRAAEWFIVQIPRGATVLKPDFGASVSEISASHERQPNQSANATHDSKTDDLGPKATETPGSASDVSLRETQQTGAVCRDASKVLDRRAERHVCHVMQIARDKGRTWDRLTTFGIIRALCKTHRDDEIKWVIEHNGPAAETPRLIRGLVLKKPTAAEIQAEQEARERKSSEKLREDKALQENALPLSELRERLRGTKEHLKTILGPRTQRGTFRGEKRSAHLSPDKQAEIDADLAEIRRKTQQCQAASR